MKKISAAILAITAVTAISCQREIPDSGTVTGEVEFTVTAGIPGGISTYADPVAAFSHNGGAVNVDPTEYDLRYILEVYTQDEDPVRVYRKTVIVPDDFTTTDVTITARLVAKTYDFVFWADFVPEGSGEDTEGLHYDTAQLTSVSYKKGTDLEDLASEAIDAYCHVKEVDLSTNQNISGIKLHRPFGKIRLLATDKLTEGVDQDEYPAETTVDFKDVTVPASFNALTGLPLEQTITIGQLTAASTKENALVNGDEYPDSYLLGYYYIFAADGNTSYAMDVTTYDQKGTKMGVRNLSQIPVQKNKLTTVIGNFYTNEGTLQIIVEDPFKKPENYINQALLDAAKYGGTVTLDEDCIFTQPFIVNPGPGNTTEINLNGHTLESINPKNDAIWVQSGTLIINGDGYVGGENGYYAVWATGDSKVILNGGNYFGNGACIQAKDNAQIEINGGYYKVAAPYNDVYFVINLQDNQPNTIVVTGGQFENCDPSNTGTEPAGVSDNFVANGYSSVKISDDPIVYEVVKGVGATDGQSLKDAIDSEEPFITLMSDMSVSAPILLDNANADIELDLNGNTLTFEANTLVNVAESEITFKNGTISAQNLPDVVNDLMAVGENGTIILDNVKFNTNGSGIGTEQTKNGGHIIIRNSEIQAVAYAVATNATLPVSQNVEIEITGSTLKGYTPLLINIPCDITVDDCNIIGTTQGTVFRGGTAKVINSSITLMYDDNDYEAIAAYFNNRNWGSGNMVNVAALTIGNKAPSAYQYPTEVTLENTELILAGAHGSAFPALYAYANDGEGLGVTLTYDEASKFGGDLVYGSENIVVNGKEVTPNEQ